MDTRQAASCAEAVGSAKLVSRLVMNNIVIQLYPTWITGSMAWFFKMTNG